MGEALDLYETEFIRWAGSQARALRAAADARVNLPIDWENVAEEIESLGKSQRRELRSRLDTIIEHLLKLADSPSVDPREGGRSTISRERRAIGLLLNDNRSLCREMPMILENALPGMADLVAEDLLDRGEITRAAAETIRTTRFSEAEVLERWFPTPADNR